MKVIAIYLLSSVMDFTVSSKHAEATVKIDPGSRYVLVQGECTGGRSVRQNNLYWKWLAEIQGADLNELAGHTKEEWHDVLKSKFAVPILERDEEIDYGEMRMLYKNATQNEQSMLKKLIADSIHVPDLNVEQMSELMTSIQRWATDRGAQLTRPEEGVL
ncbi:hypothetical protein [Solemya elarraichensis gill symbiont]|uniref:Uncharacterized protein n=1 Tax=Solemya elarraichensis gill symbiont TaxID=1918949 RepID=A0A1T2L0K5_9GAMM|nr:hypothetical protein [Solemya elarraichensis gill symbiont]OOZ38611.1 hypothetical protein BOW52_08270 [Solemya elarraichensis gill symbiont]